MHINFSDIPKNQNLFLDYLYEFENVAEFYKHDFREKEKYGGIFRGIIDSRKKDKINVASVIKEQYLSLPPASEKTLANIDLLKNETTLTVVTGQQIGILGGPLYTLYKIITAVKLARQLKERFEEFNFVPVFWLEADDHDFNEIRSVKVINDQNELESIGYLDEIPGEEAKQSVGNLAITSEINSFFEKVSSSLRETEFTAGLLGRLKDFYSEGKTLKQAFRELIFWLFDEYGLVILDPQDVKVKSLLAPVFEKEVERFREHTQELVLTSAKLEEIYHAQVKIKPVNLFYSTDDGRYPIEPVDENFRLKRKRKQFSRDELLNEIRTGPHRFSPNVLLRPICQDYLLPTAFYIAGPSEISYFAQITPMYDFFDIAMPVIYPRASVTIIEKGIRSNLDKYNLELKDIFIKTDSLKEQVISGISDTDLDTVFESISQRIESAFDDLRDSLASIDKTISDSSDRYREKAISSLGDLKNKAVQARNKRHEISLKQIDKIAGSLYPSENLQERELNFVFFANKYGDAFIQKLFDETLVNCYEHQVVHI